MRVLLPTIIVLIPMIAFAQVKRTNPPTLSPPTGYTHIVEVAGPNRTIYISGQIAYDKEGKLVGAGDMQAQAEQVWKMPGGAILCFWHARIPLGPQSWPQGPDKQDMRALISRSADGEFIALTVQQIGFPAIRGSSKKASDPGKNKHGEQAFRDMIKWVKGGGGIAITPDGPRGPARRVQPGAIWLASATGNPIVPFHIEASRFWTVKSWDRHQVPKPGSTVAVAIGEAVDVPSRADETAIEFWRATVEARLVGLEERARQMLQKEGPASAGPRKAG